MAPDRFTAFSNMAGSRTRWLWLLLVTLLCYGHRSTGQSTQKYLVLLRDKANSPYSVDRPEQFLSQRSVLRRQKQNIMVKERDLPVNPAYVTQLRQAGATVWYSSRWLNAVLLEATTPVITRIQSLPFVQGLELGQALASARVDIPIRNEALAITSVVSQPLDTSLAYGVSQTQLAQLGADVMHQRGYHGEGMLIGVLDAGFRNANTVRYLKPLFDEKRVVATYDFVTRDTSVYEDDAHGVEVLSTMAATADGTLYGTAYKASYVLLRTEDAATEKPIEEANWLIGAEYADSAGVDIINSSLGYFSFDPPYPSHIYTDLTGTKTLISRAAQWAAEAGIVVVNSAGNEGNNAWRYIIAPADAPDVLAIGGVTSAGTQASFSSIGPSADGRVKPDLAALGSSVVVGLPDGRISYGSGTSFASPLVAGLVAGFWQAHPRLTAVQVREALRRSGSQYATPDNRLGYGIPNFERASVLSDALTPLVLYPNPFSNAIPLSVQWDKLGNTTLDAMLTDLTGRVLWRNQYPVNGIATFVLPNLNLAAGVYLMQLIAGDQRRTVKVVKQ
ncbi:S8 family serine peptidase [Spirosoma sp. KUDC1026]|uniref:S8 family serine peptidase n=1 Tax=Spirosoma sp. KUDC1026 TaxID=2745947 RepID=UPI00159BE548|nr:S8 family serine peptidase [Spirosoma sp. KUDC1026]QKZ14270.1 S8 family serine peptidase [Spirosoma sp. KUDC1026]